MKCFFSLFITIGLGGKSLALDLKKNLIDKKELSIALNAEFETLHPIVNSMMASIYVQDATLRPLVALTPEGKPRAILIKQIPSLENGLAKFVTKKGKKGLIANIEFLPEARWGDGTSLTCHDLKTTWEIGIENNVSTPNRDEFQNITDINIDEKNPKKCAIHFNEAKWDFYLNFPRPIASHLEKKVFTEHRAQAHAYERNSLYVREPGNPGLYNGPYRVGEIKFGSHVILLPNENYFGKKPYFQKVIFKFILNTSTMESNLRSGNVSMASSSGLGFDQALVFEKKVKQENLPYEVLFSEGYVYSHVDMHFEHFALKDISVRQALAYAVNKEELSKAFFEGKQKPALHFSNTLDSWFVDDPKQINVYAFDRQKANQILDKAGWILNPKDKYRYKDGKKFSVTISGIADNRLNETLQVFLQSAWKNIGVELLIKNYPARVFFAEIVRKRNYDMALYSFVFTPNSSQRSTMHSAMIPSTENSWSGANRPGWRNKKVDQWLDQVEVEFDPQKRIALMKKVINAYTEELPALPLYYRSVNSVIPKGLKNYRQSGHAYSEYLEIENWMME